MIPQEALQRAAELVVQERSMLLLSFEELKRIDGADKTSNTAVGNAYLESFMIHYRNLLDFLEPRDSARDDDIKSTDFCRSYVSRNPPIQYRQSIDKRLAHLSYGRLEVPTDDKPWPISEMLRRIEVTWAAFIDALDEDQSGRSDWFGPQTPRAASGKPFLGVSAEGVVSASTSATEVSVIYLLPS